MKSILIKDTTREEREKIVNDALGCGSDCSMCCACGAWKLTMTNTSKVKKKLPSSMQNTGQIR